MEGGREGGSERGRGRRRGRGREREKETREVSHSPQSDRRLRWHWELTQGWRWQHTPAGQPSASSTVRKKYHVNRQKFTDSARPNSFWERERRGGGRKKGGKECVCQKANPETSTKVWKYISSKGSLKSASGWTWNTSFVFPIRAFKELNSRFTKSLRERETAVCHNYSIT